MLNDREPKLQDDTPEATWEQSLLREGLFIMYSKQNFDLMEIAMKMPNAILQISAGDLCEFANQLINSATEVARLQIQRADISKELLTIDEVCEMLKVSKMTLHRWDKNGVLKKIEVGGHRRYRRSDVEAVTLNRKDA